MADLRRCSPYKVGQCLQSVFGIALVREIRQELDGSYMYELEGVRGWWFPETSVQADTLGTSC